MIPFSTVSQGQLVGLRTNPHKAVILTYDQYDCLHGCSYTEIDVSNGVDDSPLGNVEVSPSNYVYTCG